MFLEKLIQKQKELDKTDVQFATLLDVSRELWNQTKNGRLKVGESLMRGALRVFPELGNDLLIFLQSNGSELPKNGNIVTQKV